MTTALVTITIIALCIFILFSIAWNVITTIISIISTYYVYKFSKIIISVDDALEETFEILDEKYRMLCILLEKPVFLDSPEIRSAISDLKRSRDSILYVANVLALSIDPNAIIEEITDDLEKK